jgi:hypothetical protein
MSIEIVDTFQNSMRDATLSTGACAPSPLVVYARRSHSPRNVSTGLSISIEHDAVDGVGPWKSRLTANVSTTRICDVRALTMR